MNEIEPISCAEALQQLLTFLDGELPDGDEQQVDQHLKRCRSCWSRAEFERRLKGQLGELGRAPVGAELEVRIRSLLSTLDGER